MKPEHFARVFSAEHAEIRGKTALGQIARGYGSILHLPKLFPGIQVLERVFALKECLNMRGDSGRLGNGGVFHKKAVMDGYPHGGKHLIAQIFERKAGFFHGTRDDILGRHDPVLYDPVAQCVRNAF